MGKGKGEIVGRSVGKPGEITVGNPVGIGWSVGGPAEGNPSEEKSVGKPDVGTPNEGKFADGKLTEGSPVGRLIVG